MTGARSAATQRAAGARLPGDAPAPARAQTPIGDPDDDDWDDDDFDDEDDDDEDDDDDEPMQLCVGAPPVSRYALP